VNQPYPLKAQKQIYVQLSGHRLTNYDGLNVFSDLLFDKLGFSQLTDPHLDLDISIIIAC